MDAGTMKDYIEDLIQQVNALEAQFHKLNEVIVQLQEQRDRAIELANNAVANRDKWQEIAELWSGAYSVQTYINGLEEIETADLARQKNKEVFSD
jgi:cell division septum initiation protein DivIVA